MRHRGEACLNPLAGSRVRRMGRAGWISEEMCHAVQDEPNTIAPAPRRITVIATQSLQTLLRLRLLPAASIGSMQNFTGSVQTKVCAAA